MINGIFNNLHLQELSQRSTFVTVIQSLKEGPLKNKSCVLCFFQHALSCMTLQPGRSCRSGTIVPAKQKDDCVCWIFFIILASSSVHPGFILRSSSLHVPLSPLVFPDPGWSSVSTAHLSRSCAVAEPELSRSTSGTEAERYRSTSNETSVALASTMLLQYLSSSWISPTHNLKVPAAAQ
jgi:hypothetical protein